MRPSSTTAAIAGSTRRGRGPVGQPGARARARALARARGDRRRRRRARRTLRRTGELLEQLVGAARRPDAHRPRPLRLRALVPGPLRAGTSLTGVGGPTAEVDFGDAGGLRDRRGGGADPRRARPRGRCRTRASTCWRAWASPTRGRGLRAPRHLLGARSSSPRRRRATPARASPRSAPCAPACARRAARVIGAGIHPDGAFGDVVHVDEPRYHRDRRPAAGAHQAHADLRAARARRHARRGDRHPRLQRAARAAAAAAGAGRQLAVLARTRLRPRHLARTALPRLSARGDPARLRLLRRLRRDRRGVVAAGDLPDYTFLWWDIRPHPRLGTVEVRAMDSQSALWSAAGLAALVHGLARAEAHEAPRRLAAARGADGGLVHRRPRRAARAAADGRRAAPRARGRPGRARARAPARRGARLGRRAGGHRADPAPRATAPTASGPRTPAAGCRRCSTCSWPRPRRPTDRRRRCRRS